MLLVIRDKDRQKKRKHKTFGSISSTSKSMISSYWPFLTPMEPISFTFGRCLNEMKRFVYLSHICLISLKIVKKSRRIFKK